MGRYLCIESLVLWTVIYYYSIGRNNAIQVVSSVQEDGLFEDATGTSGRGYRPECRHRNGLFMGHECVVLAEEPGRCPRFPGARDVNGGDFEDDERQHGS